MTRSTPGWVAADRHYFSGASMRELEALPEQLEEVIPIPELTAADSKQLTHPVSRNITP